MQHKMTATIRTEVEYIITADTFDKAKKVLQDTLAIDGYKNATIEYLYDEVLPENDNEE